VSRQETALAEVGTEELPPKALARLAAAFREGLLEALAGTGLAHGQVRVFATPRRLALQVTALAEREADRETLRRGPAVGAAFTDGGAPTKAAEGFARSCGVGVESLEREQDAKGEYLVYRRREPGRTVQALLPELVLGALEALPVPRRMRWGAGEAEFVRPVHWAVLLYGGEVLGQRMFGIDSGRHTRGHRFHAPEPIAIEHAADYEDLLAERGSVIADFDRRRERVRTRVETAGRAAGGAALIDEPLLEEVTALVEWPVAIAGRFDARFLELPRAVLIATMQDHQRYFPVLDQAGELLPHFITVANIDSRDPAAVATGNERVIRPRLADAAFFHDADLRAGLEGWREGLEAIVYQERLGSLADKTRRVRELAGRLAGPLGAGDGEARRAAELSRCDLLSAMVGEFPELQGTMGGYYAGRAGESEAVCAALGEFYLPRHAGDALPATPAGQAIALADRLDTLVGIFGIGLRPSGDKDPYALRRAGLGLLRTCIERELDIDLAEALADAAATYSPALLAAETQEQVLGFLLERLRAYYLDNGYTADVFEAVLGRRPTQPLDFHRRMLAVSAFKGLPESEALAAANKRIGNILRKASESPGEVEASLLAEPAERELHAAVSEAGERLAADMARRDYQAALTGLSRLRAPVDTFFDQVMVMCEDERLRLNRLGLLQRLHNQFLQIADIGKLHAA